MIILTCVNPYCSKFLKEFEDEGPWVRAKRGEGWPTCSDCGSPVVIARQNIDNGSNNERT